jgi:ACS family tartrate transporter-like MFS transporter
LLSITLWTFAGMGYLGFHGPFWSLPSDFLSGSAAASGIALITSIGSLGGFVGPYLVGMAAKGQGGIYRGLAIAGVSFFMSAAVVLVLPKNVRQV